MHFVHPTIKSLGLDPGKFDFVRPTTDFSDPWPSEYKSELGKGYISVNDIQRVFPNLPRSILEAFSNRPKGVAEWFEKSDHKDHFVLFPDTGISISDLIDRLGSDSVCSNLKAWCAQLGILTQATEPTWRLLVRKDRRSGYIVDFTTSNNARSIFYGMQMLWLLRGISVSNNAYHYPCAEEFNEDVIPHLMHSHGVVYLIPVGGYE